MGDPAVGGEELWLPPAELGPEGDAGVAGEVVGLPTDELCPESDGEITRVELGVPPPGTEPADGPGPDPLGEPAVAVVLGVTTVR